MKSNVNVDRQLVRLAALVVVSISVLLTTGCVTWNAPESLFRLVENDSPHLGSVEGTNSASVSYATVRDSDTRWPLFVPKELLAGPLVANQAIWASDNRAWPFAPDELVIAPLILGTNEFDPFGIDPHLWISQTDLRLEFDLAAAPGMEPTTELTESQVVLVDVQPTFAAPMGILVPPVANPTILISRQVVWQSVMKVTAVSFLAIVLLVPMGCSFVAGVVCGQPRAGPNRRRAGRRRAPGLHIGSLSRAIANIPSH